MKRPVNQVKELAKQVRKGIPGLSDLTGEQLEEIAKMVIIQRLVKKFDFEVSVSEIDCVVEEKLFLESLGKRRSIRTQELYTLNLRKLSVYCKKIKKRLFEFTYRDADNYIIYLVNLGYSPASVGIAATAASCLCKFIERRHYDGVTVLFKNPFRGCLVKPKIQRRRQLEVPSREEVELMLQRFPPKPAALVALMSGLGLRCGAFTTLAIDGNRYSCYSKGRAVEGYIPEDLVEFLKRKVNLDELFIRLSIKNLKQSIRYYVGKLYDRGEIRAWYSCHDFRHYFAIQEYEKDRDIWRVSKLLNHQSLASTEIYLKGLNLIS
jgi:site-specific recombinase XerD